MRAKSSVALLLGLSLAFAACRQDEEVPPSGGTGTSGWQPNELGADYGWIDMCTVGPQTVYAIGQEGAPVDPLHPRSTLKRSLDQGGTWTEVAPNDGALHGVDGWRSVHFVNEDLGFVVGNAMLARTADGGSTWDTVSIASNVFVSIRSFSPTRIFGFGAGGFLVSIDSGLTWSQVMGPLDNNVRSMDMVDGNTGWAVGAQGYWRTTDQGLNWEQLSNHGRGYGIDMVDPLVGAVICDQRTGQFNPPLEHLWVTEDGGLSWTDRNVDTLVSPNGPASMMFATNDLLIMGGANGLVRSADKGATWASEAVSDGGFPVAPFDFERTEDMVLFLSGSKVWRLPIE